MNPKATISPNDLQTGDLLFFHGVGTAFDNAIETVTRSPYPHVAMIVRNPPWMEEEGIYVIQSLFQCPNYDAVEQHEHKTGVQLNRLNDVRGERIDVRVLTTLRDDNFRTALANAHAKVHNVGYDYNPLNWLRATLHALGLPCMAPRHHTSFWCSALVAYLYVQWGILPSRTDWSTMSPSDMSTVQVEALGPLVSLKWGN